MSFHKTEKKFRSKEIDKYHKNNNKYWQLYRKRMKEREREKAYEREKKAKNENSDEKIF